MFKNMTRLSVNINKIATLRNARGGQIPDVVKAALDIERFGADGITVHPRPDQRHIRFDDVYKLRSVITTEFNVEGYPDDHFLDMVCEIRPHQVTLVPDAPNALTSSAGWDVLKHRQLLKDIADRLHDHQIRVSIFIDPVEEQIRAALHTGTDRIELYTEAYARHFSSNPESAITPYIKAAQVAAEIGLGLNAGHDLSLQNLRFFSQKIPWLHEVSIGHALIADALYYGLDNTVRMYKSELRQA
jgi:pyridoxine 5-phosphate synthase